MPRPRNSWGVCGVKHANGFQGEGEEVVITCGSFVGH